MKGGSNLSHAEREKEAVSELHLLLKNQQPQTTAWQRAFMDRAREVSDLLKVHLQYADLAELKVGDKVIYRSGQDDCRVAAIATVAHDPGSTGVYVSINANIALGEKAEINMNREHILAGAMEVCKI